jgi:hypothetical protein
MPKLLIAVTNCHSAVYPPELSRKEPPNNSLCVKSARNTWIKDATRAGIDVKFFFGRYNGPPGTALIPKDDEIFLDCDDSYDGLVDKVTAMAKWAYDQGYDYFMKVDVDSYVHVQNLLKETEFFKWDYVGRGWGLGYLLSRHGMRVIIESRQKRSWAEDSHVLRTIFAYGQKPGNKISMYGDGRFVFLPNLRDEDLPLYDKSFIAVNPMTPESMYILNEYQSLEALMPFSFAKEDLWTVGEDRVQHCSVHNAFSIRGEKIPFTYEEWIELTPYERQPFLDWMQVVFACLETDSMSDCLSFAQWMSPVDYRRELLDACIKINVEAANKIRQASKNFKIDQLRGSNESV